MTLRKAQSETPLILFAKNLSDRRKFLSILTAAAGSVALAACGGGGSDSNAADPSAVAAAQRRRGGGSTTPTTPTAPATPTTPTGYRIPNQQPFSSASSWNVGIGANAQWSGPNDPDTLDLRAPATSINSGEWSMPYYIGQATDPLVTIICTDTLFPVPPQTLHVPAGATPSLPVGGDCHMTFFDVTQPGLMWSYWGCTGNTQSGFTAGLGTVDSVCGDLASDYNFGIGTIRQWELNAGSINHMLRLVLPTTRVKSPTSVWNQGIPWPNTREDYNGPTEYTGNVIYGSTCGIPASVNLASLGLTTGGLMLATAIQKYGAIIRDTDGADGPLNLYAEPSAEGSTVLAQMRQDLPKIQKVMCILRNQSASTVNGGGASIAPAALPLTTGVC